AVSREGRANSTVTSERHDVLNLDSLERPGLITMSQTSIFAPRSSSAYWPSARLVYYLIEYWLLTIRAEPSSLCYQPNAICGSPPPSGVVFIAESAIGCRRETRAEFACTLLRIDERGFYSSTPPSSLVRTHRSISCFCAICRKTNSSCTPRGNRVGLHRRSTSCVPFQASHCVRRTLGRHCGDDPIFRSLSASLALRRRQRALRGSPCTSSTTRSRSFTLPTGHATPLRVWSSQPSQGPRPSSTRTSTMATG